MVPTDPISSTADITVLLVGVVLAMFGITSLLIAYTMTNEEQWKSIRSKNRLPLWGTIIAISIVVVFAWNYTSGISNEIEGLEKSAQITGKLGLGDLWSRVLTAGGVFVAAYLAWKRLKTGDETLAHEKKRHEETLELENRSRLNERFGKAIEQLGAIDNQRNPSIEIRLGGIYSLEKLANDHRDRDEADDYWTIMVVLAAYVRQHATFEAPPKDKGEDEEDNAADETKTLQLTETERADELKGNRADIKAIMTVIGRRNTEWEALYFEESQTARRLDLRGVDLRHHELQVSDLRHTNLSAAHLEGASLLGAHLEGAYLRGANLERADLSYAHLEGAHLRGANLEEADLSNAHLEGADLIGAHLEGADLLRAHLEGAHLGEANFESANLSEAQFEGADLSYAHLEGADLIGANLEGADLSYAHLEGADLGVTRLKGANLHEANLEGAHLHDSFGLTQKQIDFAFGDEDTPTP